MRWAHSLFAAACLAAIASIAAGAAGLLSPFPMDSAKLLPPPPPDGSPAAKAELAELLRIEMDRSPARLDAAKADDKNESAAIFAGAVGPGFDLKELPATAKLFGDVRREERDAANAAKIFFKRHRPWIVDPDLRSCSRDDAPDSSYPSGHATMGYAMGTVLATLAPDKAQAILARAADYAESRLICGMHFRRDIEAGHVLGVAVALDLMHNGAFMADYAAAAAELRAAKLIP